MYHFSFDTKRLLIAYLKKSSVSELLGNEPFDRLNALNLKIPLDNKQLQEIRKLNLDLVLN